MVINDCLIFSVERESSTRKAAYEYHRSHRPTTSKHHSVTQRNVRGRRPQGITFFSLPYFPDFLRTNYHAFYLFQLECTLHNKDSNVHIVHVIGMHQLGKVGCFSITFAALLICFLHLFEFV